MLSDRIVDATLRARRGLGLKERDPLSFWHFAVPRLREAYGMFVGDDPIIELHPQSCNKGTKTETTAAFVLACAQKRTHLDGIELPRWRGRKGIECAQIVLDFPQQLLSVQPAYLRLLGAWPHHARYKGEALSSLHIKPIDGSDDETRWSVIRFLSEKNTATGIGVRGDIIAFDEPPNIDMLRELRKAAHAGRKLVILVPYTPVKRSRWKPVIDDLGGQPGRSRITRIDPERAVVRWSLHEVEDRVLSQAEKERLLRQYLGPAMDPAHPLDPLAMARIHGDAISDEGLCPFHIPTLERMLADCRDPDEVQSYKIQHEADPSGRPRLSRLWPVELWGDHPRANSSYVLTIDPSSGVDDNRHDPFEIQVTEQGSGDLVGETGGYLPGFLVGILGAGMCRQFNNALADPEVNDRWGVNVLEGFHAARYNNFAREKRELTPGKWSNEIGFHNTQKTRPIIIGAGQAWLESWRAWYESGCEGAPPAGRCYSRKVIETYMDCIMDEDNKIVGAPGTHDERLIVRGQALRRTLRLAGAPVPIVGQIKRPLARAPELTFEDLLKQAAQPARTPRRTTGFRPRRRPVG